MATEAIEQNSDVANKGAASAAVPAENSSDTAIQDQLAREDSERTPSPDNTSTEIAGESQDAGKEAGEVDSEAPDTDKSRIKSRTAKRFGELTDQLRDKKQETETLAAEKQKAEQDAEAAKEELRVFRARTLQQVDEVAAPRTDSAPTRTTDGQPQHIPPPGPEALRQEINNLWAQHQQAANEGDAAKAAQIASVYNAKQSQLEQLKEVSVIQKIEHLQAQKADAKRFWNKLMDVHESHPIFLRDKATGQLTQQLDWNSPMMKQAATLGIQDGASQSAFLGNILYYLKEAQLKMIQAERATDSATLTRARTHAQQLAEKAGLETGARGNGVREDNKKSLEGLSDDELDAAVSRQARGR